MDATRLRRFCRALRVVLGGGVMGERMVYIYTLSDPRTNEVRYVGKSVEPEKRLTSHVWKARSRPEYHQDWWMRQLLEERLAPIIKIVDEVKETGWDAAERHWIAHYRSLGCRLTNLTVGGNTGLGERPRTPARYCKHGHEFDENNTYIDPRGHRGCKICRLDGSRRMRAKRAHPRVAPTHCPRGHPYDQDNAILNSAGYRECRECQRKRSREYRVKDPAKAREASRISQAKRRAKRRGERGPKLARTHCKHGHLLDETNVYSNLNGTLLCLNCANAAHRRSYAKHRKERSEVSRLIRVKKAEHRPPRIYPRVSHCKHGHAFDTANTRVLSDGRRACRACGRETQRRYNAKLKAINP